MILLVFIGLFFFNGLIGELIRKNGKINLIFIERSNGSNSGAKKDIIFSEFQFNLQKSPREYFKPDIVCR